MDGLNRPLLKAPERILICSIGFKSFGPTLVTEMGNLLHLVKTKKN